MPIPTSHPKTPPTTPPVAAPVAAQLAFVEVGEVLEQVQRERRVGEVGVLGHECRPESPAERRGLAQGCRSRARQQVDRLVEARQPE